ncbi:hypothetical protein [Azospirillum halopraeferens]|uniref:hypothetical protein n=1 Tax=Azospirillum halopraeferens TaxID=34010 RepID=UPI0003FBF611|nr:hypothetical protein [Azospirillum halopraeferens]
MTVVQFALLASTAAGIATGIALHRSGAIGTGGLATATAAAVVIAAFLYSAQ